MRQAIYVIPPQAHRAGSTWASFGQRRRRRTARRAGVRREQLRPPARSCTSCAPGRALRARSPPTTRALRRFAYGRAEALRWTAPDGQVSDGMLVHPVGERPGRTYPLVIWHHGGPEFANALRSTRAPTTAHRSARWRPRAAGTRSCPTTAAATISAPRTSTRSTRTPAPAR